MIKSPKKVLTLASTFFVNLSLILFASSVFADEQKFIITKGEDNEMCRELAEILKESENESFIELRPEKERTKFSPKYKFIINSEPKLIFPEKYTNFELPEWEDLELKDLNKYITQPDRLELFYVREKQIKKIQRAVLDFDDGHRGVNILRTEWMKSGKMCDVGPHIWAEGYYNPSGDACIFFKYKGLGYHIISAFHFFVYAQDIKEIPVTKADISLGIPSRKQYSEKEVCKFTPR